MTSTKLLHKIKFSLMLLWTIWIFSLPPFSDLHSWFKKIKWLSSLELWAYLPMSHVHWSYENWNFWFFFLVSCFEVRKSNFGSSIHWTEIGLFIKLHLGILFHLGMVVCVYIYMYIYMYPTSPYEQDRTQGRFLGRI